PLVERMREEGEALARAAEDLAALAAEAPAARIPRDPSTPRFAAAKGALDPPVEGRIVGRFGGDGGDGVIVEAPAYAEVYAPWRGVVRFAGPFGDEGVVVILEPEADHLVVFSGLGLSRRSAGEIVAAGEPLGFLGGPEAATEEFLISSASAVEALAPQKVYMEVRQGGAPVDPEAWFAFDRYGR
ncbi:MAG: peptidoglycan DD-metalloendopeptidase family protein, partial [Pseudomonadota bacterium]